MISAVDVGKKYVKYDDTPTLVGHALRFRFGTKKAPLWALRGFNLDVKPGECVGVIGRNGSGKSTLLRMLAGVTAPTEGVITVRGRVAPLIAVGVGFHRELTGRENVYLTGTILGLSRRQIDDRFDEIVDFSEIGDFIDTPVKFYSSGMFVRLGFSVSIVAEPDIFLVDEVLAVGDLAFQLKCFDRMQAIRESGSTVVIVSHNLNAIRRLCSRTAVVHDGSLRHDGDTGDAISHFHQLLGESRDIESDGPERGSFGATGAAAFTRFALLGDDGTARAHFDAGTNLRFEADLRVTSAPSDAFLSFRVFHESGVNLYGQLFELSDPPLTPGVHRLDIIVPVSFPRGSYSAEIAVVTLDGRLQASPPPPLTFYVAGRQGVTGVADLHAEMTRQEPQPFGQGTE